MKSDEAFYVCMAKNEADEIRSRPAKLTVIGMYVTDTGQVSFWTEKESVFTFQNAKKIYILLTLMINK